MSVKNLIHQYQDLKISPVTDKNSWINHSEQINALSSILHKFYQKEIDAVSNFKIINDLTKSAMQQLSLGHKIELSNNLKLIYQANQQTITIPLLTPIQLVEMFNENWNDEEKNLIELYLAHPDTWLLINLGLFLYNTQA